MSVNVRQCPPMPGMRAWTHHIDQYPLPTGLPDRTLTEIISREGHALVVRDGGGAEWTLAHWQVDAGREYLSQKFGWLAESDSRVLDYLGGELVKLRAEHWDPAVDGHRLECIGETEWVLERNGRVSDVTDLFRA